jgi:integrase
LTPEQVTKVLDAIESEYRLIFLLMADAGLRRNEALHLRRDHVEFDHGVIFVTGKGSKERIVPITTDRLLAELEKRRDIEGWLSVNSNTKRPFLTIRKALMRAGKRAGIGKHLYHHLLRHSFGTNATAAHLDLSSLQAIMGHSSPTTTGIYQHLAGEYLRQQGRKFNDMVKLEGDTEQSKRPQD